MVKEIPLQNGMVALVDDEDFERVNQFNWSVTYQSEARTTFRVLRMDNKKNIGLADFILGGKPHKGFMYSHKDKNSLNFSKGNLIEVSKSELMRMARPARGKTSEYKGVYWSNQKQKWIASTTIEKKKYHIGTFSCEHEAAEAYNDFVIKKLGEGNVYLNEIHGNNTPADIKIGCIGTPQKRSPKHLEKTSPYKGVHFYPKYNKWCSCLKNTLGYFDTPEEAARAYDAKAIELYGDKAILNFPTN